MTTMALQLFQPSLSVRLPHPSTANSSLSSLQTPPAHNYYVLLPTPGPSAPPHHHCRMTSCGGRRGRRSSIVGLVFVGKEETQLHVPSADSDDKSDDDGPSSQDLEDVSQVKRVLEILRKNRDMMFSEVKLTLMIEDPREEERRRLLGIDDSEAPTRDDLAAVLEESFSARTPQQNDIAQRKIRHLPEVNEGKIPKNRVALRMLAEEMAQWPNLEIEAPKKKRGKSPYAKTTDTGIDPEVAAKRLNIDWDSAADIKDPDVSDDAELPPAVGYGALYLVTAFPVIIGISVVLILFYNSLQ